MTYPHVLVEENGKGMPVIWWMAYALRAIVRVCGGTALFALIAAMPGTWSVVFVWNVTSIVDYEGKEPCGTQ